MLSATEYGVGFLEEAGIEVYSPTSEELKQFKDLAVPAVLEAIEEDLGDKGVQLANDLLEAVEKAEAKLY
jgi:hypothetical protein